MKRSYLVVGLLTVILLGCKGENIKPVEAEGICREFINDALGKCSNNFRTVSSNYAVREGRVYWATFRGSYQRPCMGGGMGSFFTNMFSYECMSSERNEPYYVNERRLEGGARYTPEFASLEGTEPTRVYWQQQQLAYYAKDKKSVYFKGRVVEGADPNKFAPIFPFGDGERWKSFNVSRSGNTTFLNQYAVGDIDFSKFKPFIPVRCPRHGIAQCTAPRSVDDFIKYGNWGGVLGKIDDEVVLVTGLEVYRFSGVVSPDAFMFATHKKLYFYSDGKFYEWSGRGLKFVDMDAAFFELNSY